MSLSITFTLHSHRIFQQHTITTKLLVREVVPTLPNPVYDVQVWRVLQEVHLADAVADLKLGLETEMSEGGSNFSVGQRQVNTVLSLVHTV